VRFQQPPNKVKYWEIIADKLHAAGWSWGYCSAVTKDGWRWIVDAHKGDGKRYIVHSDELAKRLLGVGRDTAVRSVHYILLLFLTGGRASAVVAKTREAP
jgi:hypothetical protein